LKTSAKRIPAIIIAIFIATIICSGICFSATKVGEKAPTAVLTSPGGTRYNLANTIGKKITVIWISDLGPASERGVDNLIEVYQRYAGKYAAFFIISTVGLKKTENFVKSNAIPCPVLLGGTDPVTVGLTGESGIAINPIDNFFIIDKQGILRHRLHLPGLPTKKIEEKINKLID